jgi:deazaflavin-dependent oxidoreductase (nitroreductase family)
MRAAADAPKRSARLPPRWVVVSAWVIHRAIHRLSRGRMGLWPPKPNRWGAMRLTTVGRRSGKERSVILGYYEDGPNLVTMAMNGWSEGEPAWWLNLQAHPDATVEVPGAGSREVHGRAAQKHEHDRLWARWREMGDDLDGYATRRPSGTAIVVLEPRR